MIGALSFKWCLPLSYMGNELGEPYQRIAVRMAQEDYEALEILAEKRGVPLAAFCREVLKEFLLRDSMDEEIEKKLLEILQSDKFDDVFIEKVGRAMSARKRE